MNPFIQSTLIAFSFVPLTLLAAWLVSRFDRR